MNACTPDRRERTAGLVDLLLDVEEGRRTHQIALLAALLLHLLVLTVTFPSMMRRAPAAPPTTAPVKVTNWIPQPPPLQAAIPPATQTPLQARRIPVPDPRPEVPEPAMEPVPEFTPRHATPAIEVQLGEPEPPPAPPSLLFRPGMDGVSFPVLLKDTQVLPDYPALARKAGVQGRMVLEAVVQTDGSVGDVQVLQSPGSHLGFEEAAVQAVRQWRYRPGMQNGRPVAVVFTIWMDFDLQ
jgi:protein TonB